MPKLKNLAVLAAAFEAGRRYARNNPDKAARYVDQAAAFVDKQTKGKYSGQIDGVSGKVKGAVGLPRTGRTAYDANAGYGTPGYAKTPPVTPPVTPSTTTPSTTTPSSTATGPSTARPVTPSAGAPTTSPSAAKPGGTASPITTTRPTATPTGPDKPTERHFPTSKDV